MSTVSPSPARYWDPPIERGAASDRFYRGMAIAFLVAVLAGFSRTYFLKAWTGWPAAPAIIHAHAALFTGWLVLFLVQTSLIPAGRLSWHRRLGVAAAFVAAAMVALGIVVMVESARRGFVGVFPLPKGVPQDPIGFSVQAAFDVGLFAAFLCAGYAYRTRPDVHKRFMLLATISLLPAAIVRIPLPGLTRLAFALVLAIAFAAAQPLHDRLTRGRIHPVGLWGGALFLVSIPGRIVVGQTDAWHAVMQWMLTL